MRLALGQAEQALPTDVPVGCVVVKDSTLIAMAHNQREACNNPVGHAEVLALQQAATTLGNWRLTDCLVVVTLEPCPMCASLLQQARVKHVVYGADDPVWGGCGSRFRLWLGPTTGGILHTECQQVLTRFFQEARTT
jgi:tRNA(adenine34) deaminase